MLESTILSLWRYFLRLPLEWWHCMRYGHMRYGFRSCRGDSRNSGYGPVPDGYTELYCESCSACGRILRTDATGKCRAHRGCWRSQWRERPCAVYRPNLFSGLRFSKLPPAFQPGREWHFRGGG